MFCPECGIDHHAAERAEREAEQVAADREVEIERLRTKRDIEVARIQASAAKDIAEEEADADLAHAEGVADGMREIVEAAAPEPEPEPEPEPVIINAPVADADADADDGPPAAEGSSRPSRRRSRAASACGDMRFKRFTSVSPGQDPAKPATCPAH